MRLKYRMYEKSRGDNPGVYCFLITLLILNLAVHINGLITGFTALAIFLPFFAGIAAFLFQVIRDRKPILQLYSKSYPYRKLKSYGWLSAFILFEFVLMRGVYTGQIPFQGEDLVVVTILFAGAIAYYHMFVRMKISLRFLFIGIFIPLAAIGVTLGLGSYLGILRFVLPAEKIGNTVFLNSLYWIIAAIFFQAVCEEPAFRGYLMQKLLNHGELYAVIISSSCYALWRILSGVFAGRCVDELLIMFSGNFITGAIFAILFIKGRNLLTSIICHGIIDGIWKSFFALEGNPGIRQYMEFSSPWTGASLAILWYLCLLAGLVLLTFIPRKKLSLGCG
jgi:membrane protease YdiL (CAAX protease family)